MTPRFSLIVFDLDGTLVDSRLDLANAVNECIASFGASPLAEDAITSMIGEGARTLVQRALHAARLSVPVDDALDRFLAVYDRRMLENTVCYEGVEHVLTRLSERARLAVLTNKPLAPTERILTHFGLRHRFGAVCGGDGPLPRKPEPEGLLHLAAAFGSEPSCTLMVGDSIVDMRTARNAGTACCVAAYGFGFPGRHVVEQEPGLLIVDQPEALLSICGC